MYDRDLGNLVKVAAGVNPVDAAPGDSPVNGPAVDRQDFESLVVMAQTGGVTGSPTSFTVTYKVQESDDGATGWVDVSGATASITAADTAVKVPVNLHKRARYVRVVAELSFTGGSTPSVLVGATVALGFPKEVPAG